MRFFLLLALLAASALAAPTGDFDAQADDFGNTGTEEAVETVAPVDSENEPEAPVATAEPATESPVEPATEEPTAPETTAEPETETEAPEVEPEVETEAPVEPAVEPEPRTEYTESPVEETAAPETEAAAATDAPADETEAVASETEAPAADDDESDDESTSSESDDEESPAASPVDTEAPKETDTAAEPETAAAETEAVPETSADEAEPAAAAEEPVVAVPTPTGASAIVDGVTVRFALQATWVVDGGARSRGYVVKITNGSEKEVCGVTFSNNAKSTDVWNLTVNEDGSFSTKDLRLAPGQTANQFGYVSAARSRPTIIAVTYC